MVEHFQAAHIRLLAMRPAVLVYFLLATVALGATGAPPGDADDGFAPMLLPAALFCICVLLILLGIGIGLAGVMALCASILAALGIASSSVIIGIFRRRFSSGLRAFHYQVLAALGWPAGIGLLWCGSNLFDIHFGIRRGLLIGSLSGICGGLLLAFALDGIARFMCRRLAFR